MTLLVGTCVVIATLALVAIAVAAIRAMTRLEKAADQVTTLTGEIQQWIGQAQELTREARETVSSVRGVIAPIHRVAERFETVAERAAGLSDAVLAEAEPPLRTALAVARGVRSAAAFLLERWSDRSNNGRSATHGGHEGE
jgi:uncharacterized protein YoxC